MLRHTLNPDLPVLVRPDGVVQVGWDPQRAKLIRVPDGLSAPALADLLRTLQSGLTLPELQALAGNRGVTDLDAVTELVESLETAGLATAVRPRTRSASIRIHGRGPLSDLLATSLRCSGARVRNSNLGHASVTAATTDLVLLSDYLVADPHVVHELHGAKVPHLPVRVRDGAGLIGPLVVPGVTSCLRCADLHRCDRDADWPAVAAQLRGAVGSADRATVLATAALALNQVHRVITAIDDGGIAGRPPPTLNTTLEFDVETGTTTARTWSHHPGCECLR
ncbi:TOMM precursor leader peptide-binding protein [Mycolicibacterium arenosum]|uniref:TOMM leader peptide-binding protein n=1 Tax=Mycolicibacterium arenosum TaxID=2952157 RepID=A0ABT1M6P7_9MYCO|nr:TOMM precursor leader peptide-binding protein [Mycolicibacterium sp. CAU 1645]MCP9273899.1 TOMM precursor leader peptide-binding protein [Mycolicibacterium sp. CAU 1645]